MTSTDTGGDKTQYSYDAAGNPQSVTSPNGNVTSYTYTSDNLLATLDRPVLADGTGSGMRTVTAPVTARPVHRVAPRPRETNTPTTPTTASPPGLSPQVRTPDCTPSPTTATAAGPPTEMPATATTASTAPPAPTPNPPAAPAVAHRRWRLRVSVTAMTRWTARPHALAMALSMASPTAPPPSATTPAAPRRPQRRRAARRRAGFKLLSSELLAERRVARHFRAATGGANSCFDVRTHSCVMSCGYRSGEYCASSRARSSVSSCPVAR